jgi:hypothetical protein
MMGLAQTSMRAVRPSLGLGECSLEQLNCSDIDDLLFPCRLQFQAQLSVPGFKILHILSKFVYFLL